MKYTLLQEGSSMVIRADAFDRELTEVIDPHFGTPPEFSAKFPLIICDPPYGGIVQEEWDRETDYAEWFKLCDSYAMENATIALWGGVGKRGNRPFIKFASIVEERFPHWQIKNWITWGKRRAYGVADNYLFTREECLILTTGRPTFNIPLLDAKRGYAGYNPDYPAKSEFLRRTNVWSDITEIFRGKIHPTQKPDALYKVLIETHTKEGDAVFDPCGGSLTTMRAAMQLCGRRFCIVEKSEEYIRAAGVSL